MPALWVFFLGVPTLWVTAYLVEGVYGVPLRADSFRFERPWAGLLLFAVPLVWLARVWLLKTAAPRLLVSRGRTLGQVRPGWRVWVKDLPLGLRVTGVALMGPQSMHARDRTEVDGIDIVLVMDMSLSMQAADIQPNRFEATKVVVRDFVRRRPNDRIGAVVFGRDALREHVGHELAREGRVPARHPLDRPPRGEQPQRGRRPPPKARRQFRRCFPACC